MTYLGQSRLETPAFVPPEPHGSRPPFDPSQLPRWDDIAKVVANIGRAIRHFNPFRAPRWLQFATLTALVALGILAIWLSLHK